MTVPAIRMSQLCSQLSSSSLHPRNPAAGAKPEQQQKQPGRRRNKKDLVLEGCPTLGLFLCTRHAGFMRDVPPVRSQDKLVLKCQQTEHCTGLGLYRLYESMRGEAHHTTFTENGVHKLNVSANSISPYARDSTTRTCCSREAMDLLISRTSAVLF